MRWLGELVVMVVVDALGKTLLRPPLLLSQRGNSSGLE